MSERNFLRLQKKITQLSPISSLQVINQILENFKETNPQLDPNSLLWCALYSILKEHPSVELDFFIYNYMNEIESEERIKTAA